MMYRSGRYRRAIVAAAAMILGVASMAAAQGAKAPKAKTKATATGHFKLTAPDLASNGRITLPHVFNGMRCNGQNISPALQWSNPPAGTKSFAVTMYDPDAPTGSGWWHWVMYNNPAPTTTLPDGAGNGKNAPSGSTQGMTDFGNKEYGGPCPPGGEKPPHFHKTVFPVTDDETLLSR